MDNKIIKKTHTILVSSCLLYLFYPHITHQN